MIRQNYKFQLKNKLNDKFDDEIQNGYFVSSLKFKYRFSESYFLEKLKWYFNQNNVIDVYDFDNVKHSLTLEQLEVLINENALAKSKLFLQKQEFLKLINQGVQDLNIGFDLIVF